jgi:prepilin-type N-terminal cleavage/methylation domain-containing protein
MHKPKGFTVVELLIVVSIIGILASVVISRVNTVRAKANIVKAQIEMNQISNAVELLASDTGLNPGPLATKFAPGECFSPADPNEVFLDTPAAGISSTDGNFPGWDGPYMDVPLDPWGNQYIFDEDYECTGVPVGCENVSPTTPHRAIVSGGPNGSGINAYGADNIVKILCAR